MDKPVVKEPIYSLRSPGGAGKCGKRLPPITPGAARRLALPGAIIFHPLRGFEVACGWKALIEKPRVVFCCSSRVAEF
jgi:hypothetical protein